MEFEYILLEIIFIFFIFLGLKEFIEKNSNKKICVICTAVTITWISLFALYLLGSFQDKVILGILMGHTSLGLFYIYEKHSEKDKKIFRLPILLTFIFITYSLLEGIEKISLAIIAGIWILFGIVYSFKNTRTKSFVNKLIECCKNW